MCSPVHNPEPRELSACSVQLSHVAVNCNRVSLAADWNHNTSIYKGVKQNVNLVAFGACNSVAIYDPVVAKIQTTLRCHKGRVNCVKWIQNDNQDSTSTTQELVSGSFDKTLRVWAYDWTSSKYRTTATLKGHEASVTAVDTQPLSDGSLIVASSSCDGTVKIWKRNNEQEWSLSQTIDFDRLSMECLSLCFYETDSGEAIILATGGLSKKIHVFQLCENEQFAPVLKLEGHNDWIRALSFCTTDSGDALLASASQDKHIRLWRFSQDKTHFHGRDSQPDEQEDDVVDISGLEAKTEDEQQFEVLRSLGRFRHLVDLESAGEVSVTFDALLVGHEDWVYSVDWHPPVSRKDGGRHQPMFLVSASMDRNMMIWRPGHDHGVWLSEVCMGQIGGQTIGYYGGLVGPGGKRILVHGYHGEMQCWENSDPEDSAGWKSDVCVSGHFGPVMDMCWDSEMNYLISASSDQTVRVHAPWEDSLRFVGRPVNGELWHEHARPQVHGYDMTCLTPIYGKTPHRFASGAAEKVVRVFDAPQPFVDNLVSLSKVETQSQSSGNQTSSSSSKGRRALRGAVPELGLSNKPYTEGEVIPTYSGDMPGPFESAQQDELKVAMALSEPPHEHYLAQDSQWPEIQKLYGHGYGIISTCSNHSGTMIASSCVAKQSKYAVVRLWCTDEQHGPSSSSSWVEQTPVECGHTLTITQMEFSHSDEYLLTVSRDRNFCVYKQQNGSDQYSMTFYSKKAHGRIIWGCGWAPDGQMFATGSRDKKVKLWRKQSSESEDWECDSSLSFKEPVTSVAFAPILSQVESDDNQPSYILAIGFQSGLIEIWSKTVMVESKWSRVFQVDPDICHADAVRRICWREYKNELQFATCSVDHSVRLFTIRDVLNK